jgi:hypothetical protein
MVRIEDGRKVYRPTVIRQPGGDPGERRAGS